jgi:hypothetical protein
MVQIWTMEGASRRNISDDVRAVIATRLAKRLSDLAMTDRGRHAGKASGEARRSKTNMEDNTSSMFKGKGDRQ